MMPVKLAHFDDTSSFMARSRSRDPLAYGSGPPVLKDSFCAFIDILGFAEMTKLAHQSGYSRSFLQRLNQALSNSTEAIDKSKTEDLHWSHKFFTDNLVLGHLAEPHPEFPFELSLATTVHIAATHQLAMALHGFTLRGALTYGPLYMAHDIVFGEALVRAYEMESNRHSPRHPRIILDQTCINVIKSDPTFDDMVLRDSDGQCFVNYLDWSWLDDYDPVLGADVLLRHKRFIERGLADFEGHKNTYQKYVWLAQYHNFFCNSTPDPLQTGNLRNPSTLLIANISSSNFQRLW